MLDKDDGGVTTGRGVPLPNPARIKASSHHSTSEGPPYVPVCGVSHRDDTVRAYSARELQRESLSMSSMSLRHWIILAILAYFAYAYAANPHVRKEELHPTPKPLTAEQVASEECLMHVITKHLDEEIMLSNREMDLAVSNQSTVGIVLMRRRMEEEYCAEKARCLSFTAPELSSRSFSSCLKDQSKN